MRSRHRAGFVCVFSTRLSSAILFTSTSFQSMVFSFPPTTYAFSHVSPHSDDSYSAVNTRLEFPLLCENIPSLLQLRCSCLCGSLYLSLLEMPLSFHCSDLLKVFVICSEIGVSRVRAVIPKSSVNVQECIGEEREKKKAGWLPEEFRGV